MRMYKFEFAVVVTTDKDRMAFGMEVFAPTVKDAKEKARIFAKANFDDVTDVRPALSTVKEF